MYCPNCAAQNADDAKFCRGCGANLSLVPQALTGQLPQGKRGKHGSPFFEDGGSASLANGITKAFMGLGFLIVAIVLWVTRMWWGIWMLIPAFALLGKGTAEIVTAMQSQSAAARRHTPAPPSPNTGQLPLHTPQELVAPPASVTESTTRLFDEANRQK